MRTPENCELGYCGYKTPKSKEEIKFEILGLLNLIKNAEARISQLKQTSYLAEYAINKEVSSIDKAFEVIKNDSDNKSFEK
ncbi:hypothetical protein N9W84_00235 [bacterium]|nr:hypothetical protein [bacterium]